MRIATLLVLVAAVAGCSHAEEAGREAATTAPTTTATASETRRAETTTVDSGDGGLLEDLAELVGGDEYSRCVDAVADRSPETSGGKTVAAVARDVQRLRRLRFRRVPKPRYLTGRALDRRLESFLEEFPDAELDADGRALIALGALPPGSDLEALYERLLRGQVAGFYDPRSGELVVDSGTDRELGPLDRIVLAHELEHALADQALRLPDVVRGDMPPEGGEDAALAASALVEGDATLVDEVYALEHLSFLDAVRELVPAFASLRDLLELPYVIRAGLLFPYEDGAAFVCTLHQRGGWSAVNRAYGRPPLTTAEVLFPERYVRRTKPVDPTDPPLPGRAWRRIDRQAFGAADLLWLLEAPGGDEDRGLSEARERIAAWAGGELHTWASGRRTAVALRLVDRHANGGLCASLKEWRAAAGVEARIRCVGREVRVGIAPDGRTAARLVSS